jgi:dolichyl-phosphate beta-glucosyltransferase
MPAPTVDIIVPARNEARRLPAGLTMLTAKAAALPVRAAILVVDSASTDETPDIVAHWKQGPVPVRLLRSERPGKGLAVRDGLLASQAPFVGFCDADMATDLSALDLALALLVQGRQVVIGSRALRGSQVEDRHSLARRTGAAVFRAMARSVLPESTDTQCGFKFFAGPVARAAAAMLRTTGFAFDIELLTHCLSLGATVTEIPVRWHDVPGSSFSVWRHSAASFSGVAGIWLRASRSGTALVPLPRVPDAVPLPSEVPAT